MFGNGLRAVERAAGQGADFRGVASTLKPPADANGALVDPAEHSRVLIETIIEVDEEVMERYFEGTRPRDEELTRLLSQAVAQGTLIPIVCVSAKTGVGRAGAAGRPGRCAPCRRQDRPQGAQRGRRRGGLQAPTRPARWWPRSSRPASTPSCRS